VRTGGLVVLGSADVRISVDLLCDGYFLRRGEEICSSRGASERAAESLGAGKGLSAFRARITGSLSLLSVRAQ
jgi:hypothetical protein